MMNKKEFLDCAGKAEYVRLDDVNEGEDIRVRLCDSGKVAFNRVENCRPTKTIKVKVVKSGAAVKLSGLGNADHLPQGSVVGHLCKKDNQITGNIGLYYVCYLLSRGDRRWNVMPTARNARGIDVLAYPEEGQGNKRPLMLQVKTLSEESPVPLGRDLSNIVGDFWIVVVLGSGPEPTVYMISPDEIRNCFNDSVHKDQYWLSPKIYKGHTVKDSRELGERMFAYYNENVKQK